VEISAEERVPNLRHTIEVIGAYVTAGARIHHYGYFERLRENAIYCDTDSVIFIQPSAEPWHIAAWDELGDMQSELKPSGYILEFASGSKELCIQVIANQSEKTM
jgi:hypothetical protein